MFMVVFKIAEKNPKDKSLFISSPQRGVNLSFGFSAIVSEQEKVSSLALLKLKSKNASFVPAQKLYTNAEYFPDLKTFDLFKNRRID